MMRGGSRAAGAGGCAGEAPGREAPRALSWDREREHGTARAERADRIAASCFDEPCEARGAAREREGGNTCKRDGRSRPNVPLGRARRRVGHSGGIRPHHWRGTHIHAGGNAGGAFAGHSLASSLLEVLQARCRRVGGWVYDT